MQDYQKHDPGLPWNRARTLVKMNALRIGVETGSPEQIQKFREQHPDFDNYIYVVYPRLAATLYDISTLPNAENSIVQLPGVQHKGHDVYVYWTYPEDEKDAWSLQPRSILTALRDNRPYEPTPEERAANRARREAREKQVRDAKQARLKKIVDDRAALRAQVAAADQARFAKANADRAARKAAALAIPRKPR